MNNIPDVTLDTKVTFPGFYEIVGMLAKVGYLHQEDWYRIAGLFQNGSFTHSQVIESIWDLCYLHERPQRSAYASSICKALLPALDQPTFISCIMRLPG